MKGIARTQKEIEFHDRVAALGCISCRQEGIFNPWVSIHHAHGRTKPGCHMWVLPLCEPHHQNNGTAIARHPYKRRWEAKYGNEDDLIRQMWAELGVEFTEPVRVAKPVDKDRPKKSTSEAVKVGVVALREIKPKVEKPVKAKIPAAKPLRQVTEKPARPQPKSESAPRHKAKIQSAGFKKSQPSSMERRAKIPGAAKKVISEQQASKIAEIKEASRQYRSKVSSAQKEKAKVAAKERKAKYLEENKEKIEQLRLDRKARLKDIKTRSSKGES